QAKGPKAHRLIQPGLNRKQKRHYSTDSLARKKTRTTRVRGKTIPHSPPIASSRSQSNPPGGTSGCSMPPGSCFSVRSVSLLTEWVSIAREESLQAQHYIPSNKRRLLPTHHLKSN